jgi:hypothetical protein
MGARPSKPSIPKITQDKLENGRRAIAMDRKNLAISVPKKNEDYQELLKDIMLYFKSLTHYQDDIALYQLQGLVDVQEYLNILKIQIDEYQSEMDNDNTYSLPRLSKINKRDIEEFYNYIYLYTYLKDETKAKTVKTNIVKVLEKIKV